MEKVQERILRFVYADYSSTYSELLCKQGRILYVGAKMDSNDLPRDIQNNEPYGTS